MIFTSQYPPYDIPKTDILSYLFPTGKLPSDQPVWIDADDSSHSLSPRQLLHWAKRLMIGLDRLNIQPGEIVLILSPNHIFIPVAYLGIVGGGRIFSAANPIYTANEIAHQLSNSGARALLVHPGLLQNALAAAEKAGLSKDRIFLFNDRPCATQSGVRDWREMIGSAAEADDYQWRRLHGEEAVTTIATIIYSSGTTGLPKGVCVSHYNLVSNLTQTLRTRYADVDVDNGQHIPTSFLGFLPLYHAYGQLYANLIAAKGGVPIYVMRQFVYEDFLRYIQKYRIKELQVAPPVLIMLNKRPETTKYDLSSVQSITCGAAPFSKELQSSIAKQLNCQVFSGWGMTELTCGGITQVQPEYNGSIGRLLPNCECKLINDDGAEVGFDTPGEIVFRGPQVCRGYFKNDTATRDTLTADGWLRTGDIAVARRDGNFWIVDRKKELIKVNGLQVAPAELEAVLLENDDISDAAVVGIQLQGEEWPRAYVVLKEGAKNRVSPKQIQQWIAGRMAKHKQLRGGVLLIDEVPKVCFVSYPFTYDRLLVSTLTRLQLASGKIQRKVMREWAQKDAPSVEKELTKAKL